MDTLGLLGLVASIFAVGISTIIAVRQVKLARNSNQLPVFLEFFRELGATELRVQEILMWEQLGKQDPKLGFSRLPEPLRTYAYNVANYYMMVAYLVAYKLVDERMAVLPVHFRMVKSWKEMEPFVQTERAWRGDPTSFLNTVEGLVKRIESPRMQQRLAEFQKNIFK